MKKSVYVSNLYGVTYNTDVKGVTELAGNEDPKDVRKRFQEDMYRNTGLRRELLLTQRFKKALDYPNDYLDDKQRAYEEMGDAIAIRFKQEFDRNIKLGISAERARDIAMEFVSKEKERMSKEIEKEFPSEITEGFLKDAFSVGVPKREKKKRDPKVYFPHSPFSVGGDEPKSPKSKSKSKSTTPRNTNIPPQTGGMPTGFPPETNNNNSGN